jgi:hypothetical protein
LEKLLVGQNGLGGSPSWHLSLVEVVEESSGRVTYFAADRWGYMVTGIALQSIQLQLDEGHLYQACYPIRQLFWFGFHLVMLMQSDVLGSRQVGVY